MIKLVYDTNKFKQNIKKGLVVISSHIWYEKIIENINFLFTCIDPLKILIFWIFRDIEQFFA